MNLKRFQESADPPQRACIHVSKAKGVFKGNVEAIEENGRKGVAPRSCQTVQSSPQDPFFIFTAAIHIRLCSWQEKNCTSEAYE